MFGIDKDGWNYDDFTDCWLDNFFIGSNKLEYELKNCRRGTYADIKPTVEGVMDYLNNLKDQLEDALVNIENEMDS